MKVLVHDHLTHPNPRRERFIMERLEDRLDRFGSYVHRMVVSLDEDGHDQGTGELHCRISASLGTRGVVVADSREPGVHQAISGAIRQVTRGIERRLGRRQRRPAKPR